MKKKYHASSSLKLKATELMFACFCIGTGLFIIMNF